MDTSSMFMCSVSRCTTKFGSSTSAIISSAYERMSDMHSTRVQAWTADIPCHCKACLCREQACCSDDRKRRNPTCKVLLAHSSHNTRFTEWLTHRGFILCSWKLTARTIASLPRCLPECCLILKAQDPAACKEGQSSSDDVSDMLGVCQVEGWLCAVAPAGLCSRCSTHND